MSESPNILLLIADDLSPASLESVNTPNIDALADNGIVFENAWATPECSPTRATIATGRYGFRTGVGNAVGSNDPGLLGSEVTIAEALDASPELGYSQAVIGKWHLGSDDKGANAQGYDYYAGNESGALRDYYSWTKLIDSDALSSPLRRRVSNYATTENIDDAIEWLDGDKPAHIPDIAEPWFLQLAFNAPHTPYHKPPEDLLIDSEYKNLSDSSDAIDANPLPYYEASIQALDTEIGRFLDSLEDRGELDDTLIVFMGDNGSPSDVSENPDHAKSTLYEGGIEIPMIIAGDGVVGGGRVEDAMVNTTDIFATVMDLAGADYNSPADSVSMVPYIHNQAHPNEREWALSEYFDESSSNSKYGQTIRNHSYKLIRFEDGTEEFYTMDASGDFDERSQSELMQGNVNNLTSVERQHYDSLVDQLDALNASESLNNFEASGAGVLVESDVFSTSDNERESPEVTTNTTDDNPRNTLLPENSNSVNIEESTDRDRTQSSVYTRNNDRIIDRDSLFDDNRFRYRDMMQPLFERDNYDGDYLEHRARMSNYIDDMREVLHNIRNEIVVEDPALLQDLAEMRNYPMFDVDRYPVIGNNSYGEEAVVRPRDYIFDLEDYSYAYDNSWSAENINNDVFV